MSVTDLYSTRSDGTGARGAAVARAMADEAARRGETVEMMRSGSRGLFWLEPLVEVADQGGRLGYGPVQVSDVPELFADGFLTGGAHARSARADGIDSVPEATRSG